MTLNESSESSVGELTTQSGAKLLGENASLTVQDQLASSGEIKVKSLTTKGWAEFSQGASLDTEYCESQDRLEVNSATFDVDKLKIAGAHAQFRDGTGGIDLKNVELEGSAYLQSYDGLDITETLTVRGDNKLSLWADRSQGQGEQLSMTVGAINVETGNSLHLINASGSDESSMSFGW